MTEVRKIRTNKPRTAAACGGQLQFEEMKRLLTFLVFILLFSNVSAQESVVEISFGSGGRGFRETIIIRPDSTFVTKHSRDDKVNIKFLTSKETWERLIRSIGPYLLKDLKNLPSPTDDRAYDGAMFSGITISTNLNKYDCGQFDGYNPNKKLKPLLEIMLESKRVKL